MRREIILLLSVMTFLTASAYKFSYAFEKTPLPEAIIRVSRDNPDIDISFIYKELDKYVTSAKVNTDDAYDAMRQIVGQNPVTVVVKDKHLFIEALQHGKYFYQGRVKGSDGQPIASATVMFLAPKDSTIVTYGITDETGKYSIPCDLPSIVAKVNCLGYFSAYENCDYGHHKTIVLHERPVKLKTLNVNARDILLENEKTVYIPSQRQKNASQTAIDLLARIPSPQFSVDYVKGDVRTFGGDPVSIYIDYLPATDGELKGMNVGDVRKVEFFESPSDPRFQNNRFVINFVMQKYEYGGYTKAYGSQGVLYNSVDGQVNSRMQYKSMQYDVIGSVYHYDSRHDGSSGSETYRLLQPDGDIRQVERNSNDLSSRNTMLYYHLGFKATYQSENVTAASSVEAGMNKIPHSDLTTLTSYEVDNLHEEVVANNLKNSNSGYINYSGNYYFDMKNAGTINFTPAYTHSHTSQTTVYSEDNRNPYNNQATDNSDVLKGRIDYNIGSITTGNLNIHADASYINNRTAYSGTATGFDKANITKVSAGISYSLSYKGLYCDADLGWDWSWLSVNKANEFQNKPNANLYVQYTLKKKHRFSISGGYLPILPDLSHRSEQTIKASPWLSYTGNPSLKATDWTDLGLSYTLVPGGVFTLGARGYFSNAGHRYVFDYESTPEGIIRTIKQPMGKYYITSLGLTGSLSLMNRSLDIRASAYLNHYHNGVPYRISKDALRVFVSANYYAGNFNFSGSYHPVLGETGGYMVGFWMRTPESYTLSAGWSRKGLNIHLSAINFARWRYKSETRAESSEYYDYRKLFNSAYSHAHFQLSVTYTIGYGKKIDTRNELRQQGSASSGILE